MNKYSKIKDFHAFRLTGVGASDAPILAGLCKKWGETPLTLWREKLGISKREPPGPRAEWGHRLEGMVLAKFIENRYGQDNADEYLARKLRGQSCGVFKTETECRHPERPYCIAHADLVIDCGDLPMRCPVCGASDLYPMGAKLPCTNGCGTFIDTPEAMIVEAKTAGLMSARRDDDDPDSGYSPTDRSQNGIPAAVFLQVQYQLYVYGVRLAYVAVLVDTGDYREYGPIIADPRVQEKILATVERFWKLVETKKEPKPETWGDVSLMWPEPNEKTAMLGGEEELRARAMIGEYHAIKRRNKEDDERLEEIKNALGIYIGENKILSTAEGVKLASSWTVAADYAKPKEIREKHPEWYEALQAEGLINEATRRELRPAKIKGGTDGE